MTEDEAKAKWCPFARTKTIKFSSDDGAVSSANRDFDGEPIDKLHTCIASACMAWRWRVAPKPGVGFHHEVIDHPTLPGHKTTRPVSGERPVIGDGFCGLAGAIQ